MNLGGIHIIFLILDSLSLDIRFLVPRPLVHIEKALHGAVLRESFQSFTRDLESGMVGPGSTSGPNMALNAQAPCQRLEKREQSSILVMG